MIMKNQHVVCLGRQRRRPVFLSQADVWPAVVLGTPVLPRSVFEPTLFILLSMKHHVIRAILFLVALAAATVRAADKPNLIVINIDDLGYADIGPFGSKLNRTPNLDRMAAEGRKLTCFYAAPVCSPSRSALMTGCYPKRVLPIPGVLFPGAAVGLNPAEHTVA